MALTVATHNPHWHLLPLAAVFDIEPDKPLAVRTLFGFVNVSKRSLMFLPVRKNRLDAFVNPAARGAKFVNDSG
jgi:hypothetical protein